MGSAEIPLTPPLEGEAVDKLRLRARVPERGETRLRRVAVSAIRAANGEQPRIQLSNGIQTGFISGGAAVESTHGLQVEIEPHNVAIYPDGEQLRVYNLPE